MRRLLVALALGAVGGVLGFCIGWTFAALVFALGFGQDEQRSGSTDDAFHTVLGKDHGSPFSRLVDLGDVAGLDWSCADAGLMECADGKHGTCSPLHYYTDSDGRDSAQSCCWGDGWIRCEHSAEARGGVLRSEDDWCEFQANRALAACRRAFEEQK